MTSTDWQDRLDARWRALPTKLQRRYTKLMFLLYLCITLDVMLWYCLDAKAQSCGMAFGHIGSKAPETKVQKQGNPTLKNETYENR